MPLNLTTLWAWDSALGGWYFYAPGLEVSGGLANYIRVRWSTLSKSINPDFLIRTRQEADRLESGMALVEAVSRRFDFEHLTGSGNQMLRLKAYTPLKI